MLQAGTLSVLSLHESQRFADSWHTMLPMSALETNSTHLVRGLRVNACSVIELLPAHQGCLGVEIQLKSNPIKQVTLHALHHRCRMSALHQLSVLWSRELSNASHAAARWLPRLNGLQETIQATTIPVVIAVRVAAHMSIAIQIVLADL